VFGPLGVPEIIMIMVVALLLFGPRKMPQIGKSVGRALGELRRASNDFKRTIEDEISTEELRDVQRGLRDVRSAADSVRSGMREVRSFGSDVLVGTDEVRSADDDVRSEPHVPPAGPPEEDGSR